jgi:hypothetical protein
MSDSESQVRSALLDLGLEDWIPLPEAVSEPEVLEAVGAHSPVAAIAAALTELLREDRIRLYRGRWDAELQPVATEEGLKLLTDEKWYRFRLDEPNEERLYFVNVDNIRDA